MPDEQTCGICGGRGERQAIGIGNFQVRCERCGLYRITEDAEDEWEGAAADPILIGTVSGWLREHRDTQVLWESVAGLRRLQPLSVGEKGQRLMQVLGHAYPAPGRGFKIQCDDPSLLGACWLSSTAETHYIAVDYLCQEMDYLTTSSVGLSNNAIERVKITPKGWAYLDGLRFKVTGSSEAFVAMWFRESLSNLRDNALMPGIEDAGYLPRVVSLTEHVNRIDDEIVSLLRRARFVVADFTGGRGGVYFEAGYAHSLGIPVIWTCKESTLRRGKLHFDINHFNFLTWRDGECDALRRALRVRIEHVVGPGPLRNGR